jgi:hypothetical protein
VGSVAGPLIETRANGSLGKDVPAWLPTEGRVYAVERRAVVLVVIAISLAGQSRDVFQRRQKGSLPWEFRCRSPTVTSGGTERSAALAVRLPMPSLAQAAQPTGEALYRNPKALKNV